MNLALSENPNQSGSEYNIVIGGWRNTKSVIRRRIQGIAEPHLTEISTPNILSSSDWRGFWVKIVEHTAGSIEIAVGRQGEATPFMKTTDSNPISTKFLGLSAYNTKVEYRDISSCKEGKNTGCPTKLFPFSFWDF